MLKKSTILFILFAFSVHISGCQGTIVKENPVVASQPSITPIPSLQPDNTQIESRETQTAPQLAKAIGLLKPKILKVTGEESDDSLLLICPEDDFGNAYQFSNLPGNYPIPFVAFTADALYLLAANRSCSDVTLLYRLDDFSVNPMKTIITSGVDHLCISSQAPWREATVSTTYQWDGEELVALGEERFDETQDYYNRMRQYVAEENIDALRTEYTEDNFPPYCASYQDYYELPAMVLRLANKKALEKRDYKVEAIEIMEYGLNCYESLCHWAPDRNWKEGLKNVTWDHLQGEPGMRVSEAEFIQVLKNYVELLYAAGQNTDLEALLLKITELNQSMNETYREKLEEQLDNISISSIYWSAQGGNILFLGSKRGGEDEFTSGVYLLNPSSGILETIVDGLSGPLHLPKPSWSEDQSMIVFSLYHQTEKNHPIYLYQTETKTVQKLPVSGYSPALNCNMEKIAYSKADGSIGIYTLSDGEATCLPENIKGFNPIWFSDNQRILLFKSTGENPHGLDGSELHIICSVDVNLPAMIEGPGHKGVYRSMEWVVQDQLVAVYSGWDDGYYFGLFDLNTGELSEFGL